MSYDRRSDVSDMLATTGALIRETLWLAIAACAVLTIIDVAGDRFPDFYALLAIPRLIASLAFQYAVTLTLLQRRGLSERGARARFWALLGLTILSGFGILLGFVLLILPGIYLLVRWTVAVPVLIAERSGVAEALTRSGEEIKGRFWPVFAVCLLFWVAFLLATSVLGVMGASASLLLSIAGNALLNAAVVAYWCGAVAVYIAGRPFDNVAEVFA